MPAAIVLVAGTRIDQLLLVEALDGSGENTRWRCTCDCGTSCVVSQRTLLRPTVHANCKSCGCFRRSARFAARLSEIHTKHGHGTIGRRTPTWKTWNGLIQRCTNPKHTSFKSYGGRGISVCERWRNFVNFLADMGTRPDGMTLDRRDNDLGYSKENCQWASSKTQARNRRSVKITLDIANEIRGRFEHGERQISIIKRMGLPRWTVNSVIRNTSWVEQVP